MMKWWGWGSEDFVFPMRERPQLWPWVKETLGLVADEPTTPPVPRSSIVLPTPVRHQPFCHALQRVLKADQFTEDEDERLIHCYGKSFPDLYYVRRGYIHRAPDLVVFPESHEDVEAIIRLADEHNVCVVPFGGGTNIVGGVDPLDRSGRMVVTLDLRRMNRVLAIDKQSMTATIQAGVLGPQLEEDLQRQGWSLGHHPDSFEYSSLGGWLATRSAGMQSDAYGKIEDMVVALKMVTPQGTLVTRTVPKTSSGPDLRQVIVGSEGVLGVITEATMRIHRNPEVRDYRGFLFPSFREAIDAVYECVLRDFLPSMIRVQDSRESQLAFHLKEPKAGPAGWLEKPLKYYLSRRGYSAPCIMVVGFEGSRRRTSIVRREAVAIFRKHRAFPLGKGVGKTWSKDKYNVPYLRDVLMDYGVVVDVAETSVTWKNLMNLYQNSIAAFGEHMRRLGHEKYFIGCHLSHTYQNGACLYFTYAFQPHPGEDIEEYYSCKKMITDTFLRNGGTLSHHHAVGYEHKPWMFQEISPVGVKVLRGLKTTLDPKSILNPGKLIPEEPLQLSASEAEDVRRMIAVLQPQVVPSSVARAASTCE